MKAIHTNLLISTASAMIALVATPALAEEQAKPAAAGEVDDNDAIIVTARRREENMQNVPVAITAISGSSLVQSGIRDGNDLVKIVPSLSVNQNSGRRDVIIFELRGVSAADTLLPQDPGVAVYVNDFVHARPQGLQGALYDLDSVQVLYGPQGTLFGRNSTAGAVLFSTKKPRLGVLEGDFRAAIGNYERRELTGAVNLPLGEKVALRFAGEFKKRNGYTHNLTDNRMLDDADQKAFRVSALIEPAPGFTNTTVFDYYKSATNGTGNKLVAARLRGTCDPMIQQLTGICNTTSLFANVLGDATVTAAVADQNAIGPRATRLGVDTFASQKVVSIVNTTSLAVNDEITLKNIVGYIKYRSSDKNDLDGSALPGLTTNLSLNSDQWSEEFQVQGSFGNVDAIFGAYYFRENGVDSAYTNAFSAAPLGAAQTFNATTQVTQAEATNISKSLFGQATWKVTPQLSLTGGLRYTWDTRRIDAQGSVPGASLCSVFDRSGVRLPFTGCSRKEGTNFSDPSYTFSADYKISSDVLVYAAHRRGYRSGGFNPRGVNNATLAPFLPEKITDYEVGLKSDFNAGGLKGRFNLAAFVADYSNIQRSVATVVNGVFATTVVNAASARIKGGEVSLTIEPTEGLRLSGNVSYVDFKVKEFADIVTNSATTPATPTPVIIRDQTFPVAKWQYGLTVNYNKEIGQSVGNLAFVFNYKWRGSTGGALSFPFTDPESTIPAYGLADASLRLNNVAGSPAYVGVFVENAFNKTTLVGGLSIQRTFGLTTANYNAPRMFGFEVGARF